MQKAQQYVLQFYNGNMIPQIGYGTYQLKGIDCQNGVKTAINIGYKHIDTASCYKNGKDIKIANRQDIFITSKIAPNQHGYQNTLDACKQILQDLNTDYLDLLLIHWPGVANHKPNDPKNALIRLETYKALEKLNKDGVVKNIGVSNFLKHHLVHLLANCQIKPVLNQIEVHPLGWDIPTVEYCQANNILIEAYSPLARQDPKLIKNEYLLGLAKQYNKSIAQISLRWSIQHGFIVIPKSKQDKYILENFQITDFELTLQEMQEIDKLNENLHTCWDPSTILH